MEEIFNLKESNIISILLPIHMIVHNILFFIKNYYISKFNKYVLGLIILSIITTVFFYICDYGLPFVSAWAMNFCIAPVFYGYIIIKPKELELYDINLLERILYIGELIMGIAIIVIPFTDMFKYIQPNISNEQIVSKILMVLLGLTNIFLNKYTINCILKKGNKKSRY